MNNNTTSIPRAEYPRPAVLRAADTWQNLNGKWQFETDLSDSGMDRALWTKPVLDGEIIVPFVPESKLSGIENTDYMKRVWYRREFTLTDENTAGRTLIHFGAVDYRTDVLINGIHAGTHIGGYTPFTFDITDSVRAGENTVVVTAYDDTRDILQPTGKQSIGYANSGCLYTRCTGIWQTVWLEFVPRTYIEKIIMLPDVPEECLRVRLRLAGDDAESGDSMTIHAAVSKDGEDVCERDVSASGKEVSFTLPVKNPVLWDVGTPELYDIVFTLGDDLVASYFGMRDVKISGNKFLLNGKPLFQRLVLDQGYFPDGIYTPETADELRRDIELSIAAGFNGARMHMKVFEPEYIYQADHMGYLLWGEFPNWGLYCSRDDAALVMMPQWIEELERDMSSPSIIGWCPFNEIGPERNVEMLRLVYNTTKLIDPTRPVIDTSGYTHVITDIYDVHDYEQETETFRAHYAALAGGEGEAFVNFPGHESYDGKMPYFVSEFGGAFYDLDAADAAGNDQKDGWGYGKRPEGEEDFCRRFEELCGVLMDNSGVCGFCYTQLTDVMQEKNGLYTYDRRPKFDIERLRRAIERR